ncbi:GDSL esterase/lipase [Camellia lanceoleosa]|uniref:GDSL esterase/lipase n=1 Tax=Camellia lanceoleosa TaxID=1840588 RepID=A0ACC0HH98_9ERIC|nr:GDSL esterase/lipase [Camellia lanceoleosa]
MAYMLSTPLLLLTQFLALMLPFLEAKATAKVPAVIVFGDSSVDAGNNNQIPTIVRSNFEPYGRDFEGGRAIGRFSNGRIPTDFISEAFGLRPTVPAYLDPSYNISDFAIGVSFASAGTGYDNVTSDVLCVIPLWKELQYYKEYQNKLRAYLGEQKANETLTKALYVMSLGTNDFLENYYTLPKRRSNYNIDQYQVLLIGIAKKFFKSLYGLGARKISLGGLPPIGCLPLERTTNVKGGRSECVQSYNVVAMNFNDKLRDLVGEVNKEMPGVRMVFANPYPILMEIVQKPSLYGFEETAVGCCVTGMFEMGYPCSRHKPLTCRDANKFVFWDAFHPTEKTNHIIADHFVNTSLSPFL